MESSPRVAPALRRSPSWSTWRCSRRGTSSESSTGVVATFRHASRRVTPDERQRARIVGLVLRVGRPNGSPPQRSGSEGYLTPPMGGSGDFPFPLDEPTRFERGDAPHLYGHASAGGSRGTRALCSPCGGRGTACRPGAARSLHGYEALHRAARRRGLCRPRGTRSRRSTDPLRTRCDDGVREHEGRDLPELSADEALGSLRHVRGVERRRELSDPALLQLAADARSEPSAL